MVEVGTLDFAGNWKPIMTGFKIEHNACSYHMTGVGPDAVALYGCEKAVGCSTEGQKLFSRDDLRTSFNSMLARGNIWRCNATAHRVLGVPPLLVEAMRITVPDRIEVMRVLQTRESILRRTEK